MKKDLSIFISIVLILLLSQSVFGATYEKYVSNAGSGSGTGAIGDPYADTDEVNDFLKTISASDVVTIYFNKGDTWSGSGEPVGTEGDWSPIINLPDSTIVIDAYGIGVDPIIRTDQRRFVFISDSSAVNVTIQNITLNGCSGSDQNPIDIRSTSGNIVINNVNGDGSVSRVSNPIVVINFIDVHGSLEIKDGILHDFGPATNPSYPSPDTSAIAISSTDGQSELSSLSIHGMTIYNINADGIILGGVNPTSGGNIYGNTIYNCGENSIDNKTSSNINYHNNTFYTNGWGQGGTSGDNKLFIVHSDAAYSGGPTEIRIYENLFNGNYTGSAYHQAIVTNKSPVYNLYIYNNKFVNCAPAITLSYGTVEIYNNLFTDNTAINNDGYADLSFIRATDSVASLKVYNNSFYEKSGSGLIYGIIQQANFTADYENNIIQMTSTNAYPFHSGAYSPTTDYNTYFGTDTERIYYGGTGYTSATFGTYATGVHSNDKSRDPLYANPATGDLSLQSGSDEIGSGLVLDSQFKDGINSPETTWSPISVTTIDRIAIDQWSRGAVEISNKIYGVSPSDGMTNMAVDGKWTWSVPVICDSLTVYFDKTTNPPTTEISSGTSPTEYDPPGDMDVSSDYYLKVNCVIGGTPVAGDVYHATTAGEYEIPGTTGVKKYNQYGSKIIYNQYGQTIK